MALKPDRLRFKSRVLFTFCLILGKLFNLLSTSFLILKKNNFRETTGGCPEDDMDCVCQALNACLAGNKCSVTVSERGGCGSERRQFECLTSVEKEVHSSGVFVYASEHAAPQTDFQKVEVDVSSSPGASRRDSAESEPSSPRLPFGQDRKSFATFISFQVLIYLLIRQNGN